MNILVALTKDLPVGTNLALLHFLWMLVSGALLPQRGCALSCSASHWSIERQPVEPGRHFGGAPGRLRLSCACGKSRLKGLPGWRVHRHEGYRAITVDVTAFWRPALQNCPSKHYHPAANRALPAVIFGVIGEVGQIGGQRLACPLAFERVHPKDPSESRLVAGLVALGTPPFGC
jgi:hypothetical protein